MKKATLLFSFFILALYVSAQTKKPVKKVTPHPVAKPAAVVTKPKEDAFSVKDKNFLDPGVGLGTYYLGLPFGVSFEHGFSDNISAGAFVNYSSYSSYYKLNIVYGGLRGSYHLGQVFNVTDPNFDPYAGVSLGYYSVSYAGSNIVNPYASTVFIGVHAGVRYMFGGNVGAFAEVGYGVSVLQAGLSFKF